jgi:anti-anti-sigma factor
MSTDKILHPGHTWQISTGGNPPGLRLCGEIDMEARPHLERELKNADSNGGDIYVDLSELESIDVGAMRVLMDAAGSLQLDGRAVFLLKPNLTVRRIIRICQEIAPHSIQILP